MRKSRTGAATWLVGHPWYIVVAVICALFTWWAIGTRVQSHYVRAHFDHAFNLVPGLAVSVDGQEVGKLKKVKYSDGDAIVEIGIDDERFWPLHEGTKAVSRWGTTIGSGTRRIDLLPGKTTGRPLKEGGAIPAVDTQPAVDLDLVLNSLNTRVRGQMRRFMTGMDHGLRGRADEIQGALHTSSGGVESTGDVMADLAGDTAALRSFVSSTHRVTNTLAGRAGAVRGLITVAAQTFDTFASNTRATQSSIDELAPTLRQASTTLGRVDTSAEKLDRLMTSLAPGARRLTPLARTATPVMAQARATLPVAVRSVEAATTSLPRLTGLLKAAGPFAKLGPGVFGDLAPMVGCVRPYAPEAGGAIVAGAAWVQNYDLVNGRDVPEAKALDLPPTYVGKRVDGLIKQHHATAQPVASTTSLDSQVLSPEKYVALTGKSYAAVRPPGLSVGQPWFIPECGITPDGLDPSKDSEYHP